MERGRSRSPRPSAGASRVLLLLGESRGAPPLTLEALRELHGAPPRSLDKACQCPQEEVPCEALCDWRAPDEDFADDACFKWEDKARFRDSLALPNATPRDARCVFVEATHRYYVDGKAVPWSGTAFSHYCEKGFDADEFLASARPGWALKKGYVRASGEEMSPEEIKAAWVRNGTIQSRRGTLMHWQIECHLNGYRVCGPHSPEFRMFLVFEEHFLQALGLVPWRTEMNLFHCGLRLAGQADLVCKDPEGRLVILDWKRSKEIKQAGFKGAMQRPPLQHLPDCNRQCYNLQLNTYRHILETEYGFEVSAMYLVVLHPDQTPAVPHVYKVPRMEEELRALVRQAAEDKGVSQENFPGADAPFLLEGLRFGERPEETEAERPE